VIPVGRKPQSRSPLTAPDVGVSSARFFGSGRVSLRRGDYEDRGEVEYPGQPFRNSRGFDVYLRYTITIRGCSNCYASTDVVEEAPHKDLLEKNVYSENLWDNLDVAHRLVPLWAIGQASIDWVEGETDKGLLKCRTAEHKQEERARG